MGAEQRRLVLRAAEDNFGVPSRYVKDEAAAGYLEQLFNGSRPKLGWTIDDRLALAGKPKAELAAYESRDGAEELIRGLVEARRAALKESPDTGGGASTETHPQLLPDSDAG